MDTNLHHRATRDGHKYAWSMGVNDIDKKASQIQDMLRRMELDQYLSHSAVAESAT